MIDYTINYNIGKVKYIVSFSDGTKKHEDGSIFYDIKVFNSKLKMEKFLKLIHKYNKKIKY